MICVSLNIRDIRSALMRYRKKVLIFFIVIALVILLLRNYIDFNEDVIHLKSEGKEFKKKPEYSIESTILHREKEVYNNVLRADD